MYPSLTEAPEKLKLEVLTPPVSWNPSMSRAWTAIRPLRPERDAQWVVQPHFEQ
jgi:hypothetical protein